jgi:hypothetical protein
LQAAAVCDSLLTLGGAAAQSRCGCVGERVRDVHKQSHQQ